jgi:hypothetical protein
LGSGLGFHILHPPFWICLIDFICPFPWDQIKWNIFYKLTSTMLQAVFFFNLQCLWFFLTCFYSWTYSTHSITEPQAYSTSSKMTTERICLLKLLHICLVALIPSSCLLTLMGMPQVSLSPFWLL